MLLYTYEHVCTLFSMCEGYKNTYSVHAMKMASILMQIKQNHSAVHMCIQLRFSSCNESRI